MGRPEQSHSFFKKLLGRYWERGRPRPQSLVSALGLALAFVSLSYSQSATDASLNAVRISDRADRAANGKLAPQITSAEHMRRAGIYLTNRAFAPAREHWQAVLDNYPNDPNVPAALYGMARSYYVERRYEDARQTYEKLAHGYPQTKEGREASNFAASSLLRMGRGAEAAARYAEYLEKYPNGERIRTPSSGSIARERDSLEML